MPSRVIREGLLDSQRYWSVSIDGRLLFVHIILLADEFGQFGAEPSFVRRRCFGEAMPPVTKVARWLEELRTADLIRTYFHDGRRFGFIPRYRQRVRINVSKFPMPPEAVYVNDDYAAKLFRENKQLFSKMADGRQHRDVSLRPEAEVQVEVSKGEGESNAKGKGNGEGETGNGGSIAKPETGTPTPAQQKKPCLDLMAWAKERGIVQEPGEPDFEYRRRLTIAFSKTLGKAA